MADREAELEKLKRARETWVALVHSFSHELGQPLTALRGALELALAGPENLERYELNLREALELADRAIRLNRALRDLAEAETPAATAQRIDMPGMILELIQDLQPVAESRHLRLSLSFPENAAETWDCRGDPLRLQEALLNLVNYAIQSCREGGELRVSLTRTDPVACLTISTEDDGVAPGDWKDLFDPFWSVPDGPEETVWVSLGLAIAQRILEAAGGALEVETHPGQGTSYRVLLPLHS